MPAASRPPSGFHSVTPRIVVADAGALVEFLRAVFDAAGEVPADRPAEVRIGDSLVMVTSAGAREPFPAFLYVYVERVAYETLWIHLGERWGIGVVESTARVATGRAGMP